MAVGSTTVIVVAVIVSGVCSGMLNTLFTGAAMGSGTAPRAVSSAGYNFCRWFGGAVSATLVGYIPTWMGSTCDKEKCLPRASVLLHISLSS